MTLIRSLRSTHFKSPLRSFTTTAQANATGSNFKKPLENKPPLYEILPTKRPFSRILFDLDSRHSYAKLYPVYESVYKSISYDPTQDEPNIPKFITASDLMIMKKALETVRTSTRTTNLHLLGLENELLEKAAEYGNNDAVSLLAYEALMDDKRNSEDKAHAKKLISGLLERNHPLTLKLSGDLCLKNEMYDQALDFYAKFLQVENDTFLASEVYSSIGKIQFQRADLVSARLNFEKAIRTGPIDKVATCHYYLGQIYSESDVWKSRYHLELSASQGFLESFQALGFMELNLFGNVSKAQEWFKLGMELRDLDCLIGIFDCHVKLHNWKDGYRSWKQLQGNLDKDKLAHFEQSRQDSLNLVKLNYKPVAEKMKQLSSLANSDDTVNVEKNNDRWNL
ncbi:hypothetical protein WICPIJ_001948 [Wickerhamomyces pijperi]|uniref:Protein MSS2, mitochondrial n=1 Tax=Wickerhamomyces pijperi TaxID=599730 RepID=A0A9P8QCC6_WICPI|nr:hypothetical protein WICPIJ_001948 [Wickerhamomyces pijperi]